MATASAVLAVAERLDYLLLAKGAPARCIGDLRADIEQLKSDLPEILPAPYSIDSRSEDLKKMVRQLAYDIEDAIESYAQQEVAQEGKSGVLRCLFNCSSTTARRLREDFHIFRRRIDEIKHGNMDAPAEGVFSCLFNCSSNTAKRLREDVHIFRRRINEIKHCNMDAPAGEGGRGPSSSISAIPDAAQQPHEHLVPAETTRDMKQDKEDLKSHLVGGSSDLSIIAICGMGGIGKTTLARSLFDDPSVVECFSIRALTCVSEEFDGRNTLEDILNDILSASIGKIAGMETMELMEMLYATLKERRYLIVLDGRCVVHRGRHPKYCLSK